MSHLQRDLGGPSRPWSRKSDFVFHGLSYKAFVRPVLPRTIVLTAEIAVVMS